MATESVKDLALSIDPGHKLPLYRQIYEELRAAILSGRIPVGSTVPSTRELASSLNVSRTTVKLSFDILISEGYLEGEVGSGTRVCALLPDESAVVKRKAGPLLEKSPLLQPRLSAFGERLLNTRSEPDHAGLSIGFHYCRPDVRAFPYAEWRRLQLEGLRGDHPELLNYLPDAMGYLPLREEIAKYLARSRAVRCDAGQVIIVNGSQQALALLAQVLIDPGDPVALENPGYGGALDIARQYRARVIPVPVDRQGLRIESLPVAGARLLYVTPSHQFPTGSVLPLSRRMELLRWAAATRTLIVEDDYDSEFRFGSRPVPGLQGLDDTGLVAYLGTFSKTMFPSLRIGYLVLPPSLVQAVERAKWILDRHAPVLDQRALASFVGGGYLERHLRRMRKTYADRRTVLVDALRSSFGDRVEILGDPTGLHVMLRLRTTLKDAEVVARAAARGVGIISASIYYVESAPGHEFVLGYGQVSESAAVEGVKRLAEAIGVRRDTRRPARERPAGQEPFPSTPCIASDIR